MDFLTAKAIVCEEASRSLVIFVAIGCAVGRYPDKEHPMQQYPPFLHTFRCNQVCVLIDPCLEMPPRILTDISQRLDYVSVVPIQSNYHFSEDDGFLQTCIDLCKNPQLRVKLIVQDYTGRDITPYYPVDQGPRIFPNVLYDCTYSDGGCSPDLSKGILMDEAGDFIQPLYSRFQALMTAKCKDVLLKELNSRQYPVVHLFQRFYRIQNDQEEPRDWCTEEIVRRRLPHFCRIYNIGECDLGEQVRRVLMAVLEDLCVLSESYLTDLDKTRIVESPGKELEQMWKVVTSIVCGQQFAL